MTSIGQTLLDLEIGTIHLRRWHFLGVGVKNWLTDSSSKKLPTEAG